MTPRPEPSNPVTACGYRIVGQPVRVEAALEGLRMGGIMEIST
ncbi:MAG: hypothetical protein V3W24_06025 [Gemmatimonadota bacterium]